MGQEETFDKKISELYHIMWKQLNSYAGIVLKNPDWAVEAVQDAFRVACNNPAGMMTSENPEGWMMNVLKNVVRDIKRAEAKQTALMMRMRSTKRAIDNDGSDSDVYIRLMCQQILSKDEYDVIERVIFQRYTLAETARELGISLEACKKRSQRAKKKLKKFFEK